MESLSENPYARKSLSSWEDSRTPMSSGAHNLHPSFLHPAAGLSVDSIGSFCTTCRRPSCGNEREHHHGKRVGNPALFYEFSSLRREQGTKGATSSNQNEDVSGTTNVKQQDQHFLQYKRVPKSDSKNDGFARNSNGKTATASAPSSVRLEMSHLQLIDGEEEEEEEDALVRTLRMASRSDDNLLIAAEQRDLNMAIEMSLRQQQQPKENLPDQQQSKSRKNNPSTLYGKSSRLSSKSISTDGAECRALPEISAAEMERLTMKLEQMEKTEQPRRKDSKKHGKLQKLDTNPSTDGRFRISELHDHGGYHGEEDSSLASLKRSQSTGDMEDHPEPEDAKPTIDSDHSCSERPEHYCHQQLMSKNPGTSLVVNEDTSESTSTEQNLGKPDISTDTRGPSKFKEVETASKSVTSSATTATSGKRARPRFVRQKSFEIDSDSTDMEHSFIEHIVKKTSELAKASAKSNEDNEDQKLEDPPVVPSTATVASNSKTGESSKTKKRPCLTIKIDNSSFIEDSNLADSELKILSKSPTLHISGISICRSPGNDDNNPQASPGSLTCSQQRNRSSSLNVPPPTPQTGCSANNLNNPESSPGSRSLHLSRNSSPGGSKLPQQFLFPAAPPLTSNSSGDQGALVDQASPSPLSSILHIQENYLSSDDFHEALFLEKSPKASKKRRRSKNKGKSKNHESSTEAEGVQQNAALCSPALTGPLSQQATA